MGPTYSASGPNFFQYKQNATVTKTILKNKNKKIKDLVHYLEWV
jgi:hypothetical protein